MMTELIGDYQVELIALELAGLNRWGAYMTINKFDSQKQDFIVVLKKQHVAPDTAFDSETEAIEAARRAAEAWVRQQDR